MKLYTLFYGASIATAAAGVTLLGGSSAALITHLVQPGPDAIALFDGCLLAGCALFSLSIFFNVLGDKTEN